jgi:uncharacterized membrane protein
MRITYWLHTLGVVVWVGGMFFAHVALRPALATLPPQQRVTLMAATLSTFLRWAAAAVVLVIVSGFAMIFAHGGFPSVGLHVHAMTALGLLMSAIYGFVVAVPFARVRAAAAAGTWDTGLLALGQVRNLVGINLVLGLVTITIAILGHGVVG